MDRMSSLPAKDQPLLMVADDDLAIRKIIQFRLSKFGFRVIAASDGQDALKIFADCTPALVILDVMMPHLDGYAVCEQIRLTSDVPIIMLTALSNTEDRILGLQLGADDYLVKPFSPSELEARIRSVLRRCSWRSTHREEGCPRESSQHSVIYFKDFRLCTRRKKLYRGDTLIRLTALEFNLLELLISNSGNPISRVEILSSIWGYQNPDPQDGNRVVDVHISRLRRKLSDDSRQPKLIITAINQGYFFGGDPSDQPYELHD